MTALLHYSLFAPSAFSSLRTATPGYEAANTAATPIRKPWVSDVPANGVNDDWVQHDYGANKSIVAIAVQSCLQGSGSILHGTTSIPATNYGTISASTVGMGGNGIRKGSWVASVSARYVRADFTNASEARGAGVYATYLNALMELGALYCFGASIALPVEPLIDSDIEYAYPQQLEKLPNGQEVQIDRGAPTARIRLRFKAGATHDIEKIARLARAGLCWLDLGIASAPELQWPVRFIDDKHTRSWVRPRREPVNLTFKEIT